MMKINYKKTFAILLSSVIILPSIAFAAGLIPCDGSATNPCDFNAVVTLINTGIDWFTGISVAVAAITFSIAGANILLHPDSAAERTNSWNMFTKTLIGMIIVLGAWLVLHTAIKAIINPNTNALRFLGN